MHDAHGIMRGLKGFTGITAQMFLYASEHVHSTGESVLLNYQ